MYKAAEKKRNWSYYKKNECLECRHYYICDGVEKQIKNITVKPEPGEKINQVNFYRKGWYAKRS